MTAGAPPTARWLDRPFSLVGVRLLLWLFVAALFIPGALVDPFNLLYTQDEHYFFMYEDAARRTIVDYGQLPDWNPWYCGGVPGMANPQGTPISPDFILRILFGVGPGRRLAILFFLVLGMEGLYRLARDWDASPLGAAAAAASWATSGWFAESVQAGWVNHLGFFFLPWIVLAFQRGLRSPGWRVAGGFFLAWALEMGGTYSVPHAVVVLALLWLVETARLVWKPRLEREIPWTAPTLTFAIMLGTSLLFGAVKALPVLEAVWRYPRVWYPSETLSPPSLLDAMVRWQDRPAFVGSAFLVVALLGVIFADRRAALAMGIAAALFAIALGNHGPLSPYVLLRKLPAYGQLRATERFAVDGALFLALSAARAMTVLEDWLAHAAERLVRLRLAGGVLGSAVAAWLGIACVWTMVARDALRVGDYGFGPPLTRAAPFHQSYGNRWDAHVFPPVNLGSLQCWEEIPFPQSGRLRADLAAEEYPVNPEVATVERKKWSPNELLLAVRARNATTILVNQNWHRGWRSSKGKVRSYEGLLAVDVPAGEYEVRLTHRDTLVMVGVVISILAHLAGAALLARWLRDRYRKALTLG